MTGPSCGSLWQSGSGGGAALDFSLGLQGECALRSPTVCTLPSSGWLLSLLIYFGMGAVPVKKRTTTKNHRHHHGGGKGSGRRHSRFAVMALSCAVRGEERTFAVSSARRHRQNALCEQMWQEWCVFPLSLFNLVPTALGRNGRYGDGGRKVRRMRWGGRVLHAPLPPPSDCVDASMCRVGTKGSLPFASSQL